MADSISFPFNWADNIFEDKKSYSNFSMTSKLLPKTLLIDVDMMNSTKFRTM